MNGRNKFRKQLSTLLVGILVLTTVLSYTPIRASEIEENLFLYQMEGLVGADYLELEEIYEDVVEDLNDPDQWYKQSESEPSVQDDGYPLEESLEESEENQIEIMPLDVVTVSTEQELSQAIETAPNDGTLREIVIVNSFYLDGSSVGEWLWISGNRNISIDGNGHTLTRITGGRHFLLTGNATLTLRNVVLTNQVEGEPQGDIAHGGIQSGHNTHLNLEEGVIITGNFGIQGGGVSNSGTLIMNGGEISGNNVTSGFGGGGVMNHTHGTFIMNDGLIHGNTSPSNGGGVTNFGTFTMNDGTISDNTANRLGGGVANFALVRVDGVLLGIGTFTMNGGLIDDNTATYGGGIHNTYRFTMNAGTISNNRANGNGGAIHLSRSTLYDITGTTLLNGGTISGNRSHGTDADSGGGALDWTTEDILNDLTIAPGVVFSNNTAASGSRINDQMNLTHNTNANGRINPGSWTGMPTVAHVFNNHDIRTTEGTVSNIRTVTFNLHGGSGDFPTQNVEDGELATAPTTVPTRAGYTFLGWFTTADGNVVFDFTAPIVTNTVVHAQWERVATTTPSEPDTSPEETTPSEPDTSPEETTPSEPDTSPEETKPETTEQTPYNRNNNLPQTGVMAGSSALIGATIVAAGVTLAKQNKKDRW